jgi:hypothetical protein
VNNDDEPPVLRAVEGKELVTHAGQLRSTVAFCQRPEHLHRTTRIAVVVGILLTAINQGSVFIAGRATSTTWVRVALNIAVPFVVSNLGLLSGRLANVRRALSPMSDGPSDG